MAEENSEQRTENSEQETVNRQQETGSSKQGMSSGAKWGIGLGACCCCLIIVFLIFIILGFAGCSFVRSFGGYNWPTVPPMNEGTEIPIPSFSNTPTSTK